MINESTFVSIYKNEKCKFDQPFLFFQARNIFIGKSKVSETTRFSGGLHNSDFDGITILLEFENNKYAFISGKDIFEFRTDDDKFLNCLSLMGNSLIPYTFAVGEKYAYFLSTHYKVIENDKKEPEVY